ncbi:transcription initiation factor IIB [Haloarcula nitratireducens]|uniref:Transcription initiation factor IIB n=1 Tax=Haloarcula nitratireducens TaxID=2487749 RepID=A0AAW4PLU3_9EURY|nr:transcription initiation factor IIB family protein [Halomicroarcula nitratireducens]MBX0298330.1 transcription initiation factor IIB family protein [Halomicroarcula nitratireducens]
MSSQTVQRHESSVPIQRCPECTGDLVQTDQETHCESCGLVVEDSPVDHGPEWRSFDCEERKRTGAPQTVTMHDGGLSTKIGFSNEGNISPQKHRRLNRQRRLHGRARFESKRDRNLAHGLGEIRRLVGALEYGQSVRKQASKLFEQAQDADLLVGRSIESGAAAAVYAACRCNTVVQMDEIATNARCPKAAVWTAYRAFQIELEIPIPVQRSVEWVPKVLSDLPRDIPISVKQDATRIAERATESAEINGSPVGIATACVYLASEQADIRLTQTTLSDAMDVSVKTLRTWFQRLQQIDAA